MSGSIEETKKHIADYKKVAATLAVLTIVTVAVSYLEVSVPVAILIALVIASTKGSLVASVFMHLIGERSKTLYLTLALTAAFFVVLMFIPLLGHLDQVGVQKTLSNADAPAAHGDEAH
jgi:caa(3)-type oxidase subunit IV